MAFSFFIQEIFKTTTQHFCNGYESHSNIISHELNQSLDLTEFFDSIIFTINVLCVQQQKKQQKLTNYHERELLF